MRLFLLFSERKKLVESTKFLLIFLQAHVEKSGETPYVSLTTDTCIYSDAI